MATETLDPPTTTSALPAKPSFLADPDFDKTMEEALRSDGKTEALPPKAIAPVVPEIPPVKQPDAPPEKKSDDEIPDDIKSPGGQTSWKRLKAAKEAVETERDTIRQERDAMKAEFEALKKKAATPAEKTALADDPEYQQLKALYGEKEKELATYSDKLRLLDVTEHPKFKSYFEGKVQQQMDLAKSVGGERALEVLKLPPGQYRDEQLESLAAELSPMKAAQLATVLTRLEEIGGERAGEIAKARDSYEQIQAQNRQQSEQQKAALAQVLAKVRADVIDKDKGLYVFQERAGDDAWNQGVRERLATADQALAGKLPPEDLARAAYWAMAAPQFLIDNKALLDRNTALEKQISELRAVNPNAAGAKPGEGDTVVPTNKRGLDALMDDLMKVLPGR